MNGQARVVIVGLVMIFSVMTTIGLAQPLESTTVGGYGKLHYNEPDGSARGKLDFHRFVLFLAHSFNDKLTFKSELELEHTKLEAGSADGGEVSLEQAYLDWKLSPRFGLRAGIMLPPVGILNEIHEPSTFNGVERPNIDRNVIPTTWRESGAGIYGEFSEDLRYQLYVLAGLKAEGLSGSGGIRGGRQEALESSPDNPSLTGRLDFLPTPDVKAGVAFFAGNTTGGNASLGNGTVVLLAADTQYGIDRFSFRAVGVFTSISDAEKINIAYGNGVADRIYGVSAEAAYNILPLLDEASEFTLDLFARLEKYDTQAKVSGFAADPANDRTETTVGASFKPTYNTIFKLDYQFLNNAAGADTKQFNLGIGYNF